MPDQGEQAAVPVDVGAVYRHHYGLLWSIAAGKFRVPQADAENVVHDVFVSFVRQHRRVANFRAWLVSAVCDASRTYWKRQGRVALEELPSGDAAPRDAASSRLDTIALARIDSGAVMSSLNPRCREILSLHYFDELSAPEISRLFGTTERYAKVMLHRCLCAARRVFATKKRS
jgi:RNA polymerase sigma factor (sigma-70 family)